MVDDGRTQPEVEENARNTGIALLLVSLVGFMLLVRKR